jgi:hypothetical protein
MFPQAAWYDLENIYFVLKENLAENYNSDTAGTIEVAVGRY